MKPIAYCIILFFCVLTSGCVRRTVSVSKPNMNPGGTESKSGSNAHSKVVDEKIIWFWQDDFRQP